MKVMTLYWGLKLVISVGWRNVEIEGDSIFFRKIVKCNMKDGLLNV